MPIVFELNIISVYIYVQMTKRVPEFLRFGFNCHMI